MRFINFLLLVLAFLLLMGKSENTQKEIYGLDIFNTNPFECIPEIRTMIEWKNDIGDIQIYNAKIWMGANVNAVADVGAVVAIKETYNVLFHENWDRYANPTSFSVDALNLAPNYILVKNGQTISVLYWCHPFSEDTKMAHIIVTVWYGREN